MQDHITKRIEDLLASAEPFVRPSRDNQYWVRDKGNPPNHYEIPIGFEVTDCNGGSFSSEDSTTFYEGQGYLSAVPGLNFMQENPPGNAHFFGSHTVLDSFDPMPGGGEHITLTVHWDLTRTPAP